MRMGANLMQKTGSNYHVFFRSSSIAELRDQLARYLKKYRHIERTSGGVTSIRYIVSLHFEG